MKKRLLFLLLTGVLSLSGCGKKKQETPPGGTVSGVSLSESALNVQKGKRSEDVTVTIAGEGDFNKNVKLSSDNEAVATTSFTEVASGEAFKVYGHSIGTATISVVSVQDESKAASLSVTVYEKQALPVDPEISSFYLDKTTKAFELDTEETYAEFQLTVTGKGEFDKSAAISVKYMDLEGKDDAEHPCVSLDKTSVSSGEKFRVTRSDTQTGNAEITLTSKQDATKTATLQVRVSPHNEPQTDITEDVRLDYSSRTILIDDTFIVRSTAIGGDISWKLREKDSEVLADTSTYLEIVEANNDGATVRGLAEVDEINLVATVGEHKAECKFTVSEAPSDVRELYVTNNSALNYDEIYFYAWNDKDQHNADWPGVKLTEHIENTNYELCYKFSVDILKYPNYKFNNGKSGEELKETTNCTFEELGTYDNVYFREDGTYGYATIQKNVPSINFVNKIVVAFWSRFTIPFYLKVNLNVVQRYSFRVHRVIEC